jgi:hypothetical protein
LIDATGKPSQTKFTVLETFGDVFSLVKFEPLTGRTHQIRAHAAHIGHPLLCDHNYGGGVTLTVAQLAFVRQFANMVEQRIILFFCMQAMADPDAWRAQWPALRTTQIEAMFAEETVFKQQAQTRMVDIITPLGDAPEHTDDTDLWRDGFVLQRSALHASRIELTHPGTGKPTVVEAPLAKDMAATVALLRQLASGTSSTAAAAAATEPSALSEPHGKRVL